jgi:LysM repeat protein
MPQRPSSQARLIAPIALVVVAIALFAIVLSSRSGGGGGKDEGTSAPSQKKTRGKARTKPKRAGSTYTVKTGDTLGSISAKTGVDVDKLQELNPALDPQALVSGQKIKLRE